MHAIAMADPVFRARRRRWIRAWRRNHRGDCDWCMGHEVTMTIIKPRADSGGNIYLQFDGNLTVAIPSSHPDFWSLWRLHNEAMRQRGEQ